MSDLRCSRTTTQGQGGRVGGRGRVGREGGLGAGSTAAPSSFSLHEHCTVCGYCGRHICGPHHHRRHCLLLLLPGKGRQSSRHGGCAAVSVLGWVPLGRQQMEIHIPAPRACPLAPKHFRLSQFQLRNERITQVKGGLRSYTCPLDLWFAASLLGQAFLWQAEGQIEAGTHAHSFHKDLLSELGDLTVSWVTSLQHGVPWQLTVGMRLETVSAPAPPQRGRANFLFFLHCPVGTEQLTKSLKSGR